MTTPRSPYLLLIPSTGFCNYDDPRTVHTVDAIREHLEEESLLLRYRTDCSHIGAPARLAASATQERGLPRPLPGRRP